MPALIAVTPFKDKGLKDDSNGPFQRFLTACARISTTYPLRVVALWFVLIAACSSEQRTVEERGNALDKQLICPICPGETIDQAQVQIAKDMRKIVREKLAAGEAEADDGGNVGARDGREPRAERGRRCGDRADAWAFGDARFGGEPADDEDAHMPAVTRRLLPSIRLR